jgi:3-dehydroquinate dehydratase-1
MICAAITESSIDEMVKTANLTDADIVEIRMDYLDLGELCKIKIEKLGGIKKPVVATCMPEWEGGRYVGSEDDRISTLTGAFEFSDYVSIELKTREDLRNRIISEAGKSGVKVIVSYHDFEKTPTEEEILDILKKEKEAGADIAKIAFMAGNYGDVLRVMNVLVENKAGIPIIAISMGEFGKISRVLGPLFGSYLTFASTGGGSESAPGQLTVDELKQILEIIEQR